MGDSNESDGPLMKNHELIFKTTVIEQLKKKNQFMKPVQSS